MGLTLERKENAVTYATLMVNLEVGQANAGLLQIAGDLAERFHSRVIGIVAAQPILAVYDEGYMSGDLIEEDLRRLSKDIAETEAQFRTALHGRNRPLEWRSRKMYGPLADYIATESRAADLILTRVGTGGAFDGVRTVDAGELVLQAGRPVIVVPPAAEYLNLQQVVICWKDTREARRAVVDALPLLKRAGKIDIVEIAADDRLSASRERLDDVVVWLKLHGVSAVAFALPSHGDEKTNLEAALEDCHADLVVAGGYGHNRLREWVLGGVSRDLLVQGDRCSLLSH